MLVLLCKSCKSQSLFLSWCNQFGSCPIPENIKRFVNKNGKICLKPGIFRVASVSIAGFSYSSSPWTPCLVVDNLSTTVQSIYITLYFYICPSLDELLLLWREWQLKLWLLYKSSLYESRGESISEILTRILILAMAWALYKTCAFTICIYNVSKIALDILQEAQT